MSKNEEATRSSSRQKYHSVRLVSKPPSVRWVQLFSRALKKASKDDVPGRSAQLAYYFFLAIFPLLIFILGLLSMFSGPGQQIRHMLIQNAGTMMPASAAKIIRATLTQVSSSHTNAKVSLGILASLWSASAGMSAIMDTLNAEYGVVEGRPFLKRNAIAIGLTIATAILVVGAIGLVVVGGPAAQGFGGGDFVMLVKVVVWPIAIAIVLFDFALIYFFAPDVRRQKWRWVTRGALAGVILWVLASVALKIYLQFFNRFSTTYGSLGAIIILLLWFYLTGAAILLGGELDAVTLRASSERGAPHAPAADEKASETDTQPKRARSANA